MRRVLLLLTSIAITTAAHAGPPFVTDDPDIPPLHSWEINIPVTLEHETDENVLEMPLLDINYGLAANVELTVEFALLHVRPNGGRTERGLSDTGVAVKWRFLEEGQPWPQVAFYPEVTIPTGDAQRGLGQGKPSYVLPLIAQKSWGPWTAFGNVGVVVQNWRGSRNFWFHGLTLVREVGPRLELGGEVYGNSPTDRDERSSLGFNLGGTWKVADATGVLFSVGRTFRGENATTVYLGIQVLVGGSGPNSSRPITATSRDLGGWHPRPS